jgi:serine protease Do
MLHPYLIKKRESYKMMSLNRLLCAVIVAFSVQTSAAMASAPESFADLAEAALPAVVNVSTTQLVDAKQQLVLPEFPEGSPMEEFFKEFQKRGMPLDKTPQKATSLGSGFIISDDGLMVTNNHVIEKAEEITITLHDNTQLEATVLGHDPKTDLALLKIKTNRKLPFVKWGDSTKARVGDWVMAVGNPFGLGSTVTAGIISARARNINAGPYDEFIQTDAAINRGNSGGPLFNSEGEVIGINTAIFSPTGGSVGIGFAVPSDLAQPIIKQIQEFGSTKRGWLGVRFQPVTPEIAESLGIDTARGALVAEVDPKGPAKAAGIQAGDVILSYDGKEIGEKYALLRLVADTKIGRTVPVVIKRNDFRKTLNVTIANLEEAEKSGKITLSQNNKPDAVQTETIEGLKLKDNLSDEKGVVVVDVDSASDAAVKGIKAGDIILEVNQTPANSLDAVKDNIQQAVEQEKRSVLLRIQRGQERTFVALKLTKK